MLSHHYSADSLFEATIWTFPKKRDFLFRTVQKRSSSFSIISISIIQASVRAYGTVHEQSLQTYLQHLTSACWGLCPQTPAFPPKYKKDRSMAYHQCRSVVYRQRRSVAYCQRRSVAYRQRRSVAYRQCRSIAYRQHRSIAYRQHRSIVYRQHRSIAYCLHECSINSMTKLILNFYFIFCAPTELSQCSPILSTTSVDS